MKDDTMVSARQTHESPLPLFPKGVCYVLRQVFWLMVWGLGPSRFLHSGAPNPAWPCTIYSSGHCPWFSHDSLFIRQECRNRNAAKIQSFIQLHGQCWCTEIAQVASLF